MNNLFLLMVLGLLSLTVTAEKNAVKPQIEAAFFIQ